jgi:hypothetical protein
MPMVYKNQFMLISCTLLSGKKTLGTSKELSIALDIQSNVEPKPLTLFVRLKGWNVCTYAQLASSAGMARGGLPDLHLRSRDNQVIQKLVY